MLCIAKYVHSFNTVIACKLIKGTVFNEEQGQLKCVNFSNLNTVFTSKFLFFRLPGFVLLDTNHFVHIKDSFPEPIGQVSNNFLKMEINSV